MAKKISKSMLQILDYIDKHGSITQAQAFLDLGIGRLGARIFEMRERGIPIDAQMIQVIKKDGSEAYVAKYSLARE